MPTTSLLCAEFAAPVTDYHELLSHSALVEASVDALEEGQATRRLHFGDRPIAVSLRPNFVRRARYEAVIKAAGKIYGALRRLEKAVVVDAELRGELALDPWEERLALAAPDLVHPSPTTRLDGFVGHEVRFVEFNGAQPAGMAYDHEAVRVYDDLPIMQAFRQQYSIRALPMCESQLATILTAYRNWGGRRTPTVAIVDWHGVKTSREFEVFRDFFHARGVPAMVCDPRELDLHRGRLYARGLRVDLVYRRVLMSELAARPDDGVALVQACLTGAACFVSSFRTKLLHKKMSFALLSDERFAGLYSSAQRDAITRHVPWTRRLADGATTQSGGSIPDLLAYVAANRHSLVLKPNDSYGGRGVVLGWTVSLAEWEAAIARALQETYVVQERVEVPSEPFPIVTGRNVELALQTPDLDPFLFHGEALGAICRLSGGGVQNVTAGQASFVPTYVVDAP